MRGKAAESEKTALFSRITPAHAGKRYLPDGTPKIQTDHPRTCGEKAVLFTACSISSGSPPHMRGKDCELNYTLLEQGITPAHAGKSSAFRMSGLVLEDHPRTCGEKLTAKMFAVLPSGSPPHMRGKEYGLQIINGNGRITPAHAGKRKIQTSF